MKKITFLYILLSFLLTNSFVWATEPIDFGFIEPYMSSQKSEKYYISDPEDIRSIEDVYIEGISGSVFSIIVQDTLGDEILTRPINMDAVIYNVFFRPLTLDEFYDSIVVILKYKSVFDTIKIPLIGYSRVKCKIALDDVYGDIGSHDIKIPIWCTVYGKNIFDFEYKIRLVLDADIYLPIEAGDSAIIVQNDIVGTKRHVTIYDSGRTLQDGATIMLAYISGVCLLNEKRTSPVTISDVNWNKSWLVPMSMDGTLNTNRICGDFPSVGRMPSQPDWQVRPNPILSSAEIYISSEENGTFHYDLFTMQGRLIKSDSWFQSPGSNAERIVHIDTENISSGVYYMILHTPYYKSTLPLTICK